MTDSEASAGTGAPTAGGTPIGASSDGLAYGTPRGRWVIAAAVLGSGIAMLDATVVGIALPSIERSFHSGLGQLQWVVTGYLLTLSAFILIGGSLGDRLGRKRIFSIGVVWFALASALSGFAPNSEALIAARVLQGIGGALLVPASLAIIQASFRSDDRARAIGAWSGLGGLATAAGPLVGGYLIAVASWRWVFFINLPIAAGVVYITLRHVPESVDPTVKGHVDMLGASLAALFLTGLTYPLIEGSTRGWTSPLVLGGLILAAGCGVAFLAVEHHRSNPMLPLGMFRVRQFSAVNAVTFVVYAALGGALFLLPVELQVVSGYSPLEAGTALLPITAVMLVFSPKSAALSTRIGPRLQMIAGPMVVGVGFLVLTEASRGSSYIEHVLPGVLLIAIGLATTVAPLTATVMGAAPLEHAGVASAVNNAVARTGSLLAVAVLPLAAGLTGADALQPAELAVGFRTAMIIAGGMCVVGGLISVAFVRNPSPLPGRPLPQPSKWQCAIAGTPLQAGGEPTNRVPPLSPPAPA